MSTIDVQDVQSVPRLNPVLAPVAGVALYLGAVVLNLATSAGEPAEQTLTDWVVTLAIAGAAVGVAVLASRRATVRGAGSMARTSLILGVLAVLSMVVFWAGVPCVFGATALALGWAARPGTSAVVGMLLGALALVSGAVTMVVG